MIARNWRAQGGELDLIVRLGEVLVVAEVKARASDRYGGPALAVGPTKQRRIRRLTAQWLAAHPWRGPVRFDVVAITGTDLRVIKGAW